MIAAGNIGSLIDFFSFVAWMFYGGTMLTVIILRFTEKDLPRPYKVRQCTFIYPFLIKIQKMMYQFKNVFYIYHVIYAKLHKMRHAKH